MAFVGVVGVVVVVVLVVVVVRVVRCGTSDVVAEKSVVGRCGSDRVACLG